MLEELTLSFSKRGEPKPFEKQEDRARRPFRRAQEGAAKYFRYKTSPPRSWKTRWKKWKNEGRDPAFFTAFVENLVEKVKKRLGRAEAPAGQENLEGEPET